MFHSQMLTVLTVLTAVWLSDVGLSFAAAFLVSWSGRPIYRHMASHFGTGMGQRNTKNGISPKCATSCHIYFFHFEVSFWFLHYVAMVA